MARSTAQLAKIIVAPFSKLHRATSKNYSCAFQQTHRKINSTNKLASEQGKHRARRELAIVHNLSIG